MYDTGSLDKDTVLSMLSNGTPASDIQLDVMRQEFKKPEYSGLSDSEVLLLFCKPTNIPNPDPQPKVKIVTPEASEKVLAAAIAQGGKVTQADYDAAYIVDDPDWPATIQQDAFSETLFGKGIFPDLADIKAARA